MSTRSMIRCNLFGAGLLLAMLTSASTGQDPVKVAPESYKTALDNEYVRVHNVTLKAAAKVAMHSHPDHLVYAMTDGKLKFGYADGKSKDVDVKKGTVTWVKAEVHTTENTGASDFKAVVVELMKPAPTGGKPLTLPEAQDSAKVAADTAKVLFENERVRVLDVHFKPGAKQPMHAHPHYVTYALTDIKVKFTMPDGKSSEKALTAGQATWNEPVTHAVELLSTAETAGLVFEMREPIAAAAPAPATEKKAPAVGR